MVAGAAALLREVHPNRAPLDIKTMLMNTTAPLADGAGNLTPVSLAGAGRIRVDEAAGRDVLMAAAQPDGAVSVSFGAIVTFEPVTRTRDVVVTNLGTEDKSFDLSIAPTYALDGVDVTVSPTSVTVPAGQSSTVTVSLEVRPAELPVEQPDPHTPAVISFGPGQEYARQFATEAGGHVVLQESGADASTSLSVPFHAIVRAADQRAATPARSCRTELGASVQIPIEGETTHREPVTSAFQLAATNPADSQASYKSPGDLLAVGVATNTATAETFSDASVYFALAVAGEWTTPAQGPLSVVGIAIDTNEDDSPDYVVFAEPFSREYFQDILAVTTYDLNTDQDVSRRFLNLFPRDQLNTEPFNNSVVVLPVSLDGLNITEADPSFRFAAFTQVSPGDQTDWIEYDPTRPAIDTAAGGMEDSPFYPAPQPVAVQVNPDNFEGSPPEVLLLHHSNQRGMRFETVDLTALANVDPTDLTIDQEAPSSANAGASANVTWTISNAGDATAYDVSVSGTISGASAFTAETPQGSCEVGEDVRCSLGDLEAGASVTLTVGIVTSSASVDIDASVQDGLSCETNTDNNQVTATIVVEGEAQDGGTGPVESGAGPSLSVDDFEAGGGCNCGVAGEPSKHQGKGLLAVLVGLGWLAFGTRRRRKAP
jgi:MYXO-CTERM domain-containing protein